MDIWQVTKNWWTFYMQIVLQMQTKLMNILHWECSSVIILCNSTNAIASKNSSVDLCYICRPHSWLNLCLAFYVARVYEVRHLVTAMNVASLCKTFVRSYHELNDYTVQHVDDSIPYTSIWYHSVSLCLTFYVARVYEVRHLVTTMNVASLCKTFVRSYYELNDYTVQHVDD